ncbi:MAG TPA: hypothetical protein VGH03_02390, partial [Caulobacteraceae bacterium]
FNHSANSPSPRGRSGPAPGPAAKAAEYTHRAPRHKRRVELQPTSLKSFAHSPGATGGKAMATGL